jgi:hypothetical protein
MSWIQVNQKQTVEAGTPPATLQYRLQIDVAAANGIEPELFCYSVTDDTYSHVAALDDLLLYPAGRAQALADYVLYYRTARMNKLFPTATAAANASAGIQARLQRVNSDWGASQTSPFGGVDTFVYDSEDV